MNIRLSQRISRYLILSLFVVVSLSIAKVAKADILPPGDISTCGELAASGTYTLTASVNSGGGTCFTISADDVVIDGVGQYSITGNVDGSSYGNYDGYNFEVRFATIEGDIISNGYVGDNLYSGGIITLNSISALNVYSDGSSSEQGDNRPAGNGGQVIVSNYSNITNIYARGGTSGGNLGGKGGSVSLATSSNVSGTINVDAGENWNTHYVSGADGGSINLSDSYAGILSANGGGTCDYGVGGNGGTINLINSVAATVMADGAGKGQTCDQYINGGLGGIVTITNSNVTSITANGGSGEWSYGAGGNGGTITITNSTTTSVTASGGVTNEGGTGGDGGNIILTNVQGNPSVTADGGGYEFSCSAGYGGLGGTITAINSNLSNVTSNGGEIGEGECSNGAGGDGGTITLTSSNASNIISDGGLGMEAGSGGTITITGSTIVLITSNGHMADSGTGGNGGTITVDNTTVSVSITADGGDENGGDGGIITLTNVQGNPSITANGGFAYNCEIGTGGTITITNSNVTSITANGGSDLGCGIAANAGTITITDSTTTSITANGGESFGFYGGNGGDITITKNSLNISTTTIRSSGGSGNEGGANGADGEVSLTFSSLTTNTATFVYAGDLVVNSTSYGPWNGVFNPTIYYFKDKAPVDGDWNNVNNWWIDSGYTIQASSIPPGGDQVIIDGNITTSSTTILVDSIVFNNTSSNGINITAARTATFNQSSSNSGTITSPTTIFYEDAASTTVGTIVGTLAERIYTADASTVRNFTTEGGRNNWLLIAQSAVVDLSSANYSRTTNRFKALDGGSFIMNPSIDGGASVVPVVTITSPLAGTTTLKWATPSINWDTSTTCEYKMSSGGSYLPLTCASDGADIPRPTGGPHTMYLRGTDSLGNTTEKIVSFTYDNTSPVWTRCGTDLLDEATRRYYYLQDGAVTGDCYATVNTELRGGLGSAVGELTGNVIASATSTTDGFNITLRNITVTGTTTSNGGAQKGGGSIIVINATTTDIVSNGGNGTNGGNGGTITIQAFSTIGSITANGGSGTAGNGGLGGAISIATSTTATTTANGGDGTVNGGHGGTINITNSFATPTGSPVTANGGDSTSCGNGGDSGLIIQTDSTYGTATAEPGNGNNSGCPLVTHSSGSRRVISIIGTYTPPGSNSTPAATPAAPRPSSSSISPVVLPVNLLDTLNLSPLPVFGGTGANSFSFTPALSSFLNTPLPKELTKALKDHTDIASFISNFGINKQKDLVNISVIPRNMNIGPENIKDGLIIVSSKNKTLPTFLTYDTKNSLTELVRVATGTPLTVSLETDSKQDITGTWQGKKVTLTVHGGIAQVLINSPLLPGRYYMTISGSPITLAIEIPKSLPPTVIQKPSLWSRFLGWFGI